MRINEWNSCSNCNNHCPKKGCVNCESEKTMAPHSSTLAWKILWTEESGRLQTMGSLRVGHRTGEPGGLPSMGSHRVGHD